MAAQRSASSSSTWSAYLDDECENTSSSFLLRHTEPPLSRRMLTTLWISPARSIALSPLVPALLV